MIAVLADDLTSALDGAAPFVGRGVSARVAIGDDSMGKSDLIAFDLDSRSATPGEAGARHERMARRCHKARLLYKTVDSTLRGNLAAEIGGALMGSGRTRAIVAPAFAAAGRTTRNGHQYLHGIALEQTEFARDPRTPIRSGRIADHLHDLPSDYYTIHDAATDADLDALVARVSLDADVLWVGSPGLAAALARATPARSAPPSEMGPPCVRVLVVVGSTHPGNAAQIASIVAAGARTVRMQNAGEADAARCVAEIADAFDKHPIVCMLAPPRTGTDEPADVAHRLGKIVADSGAYFDGVVATGGDTLRSIVDALDAGALDLAGEVEPGVPFGALRAGARGWSFSSNAGGFGDAQTLSRCVDRLRASIEVSA